MFRKHRFVCVCVVIISEPAKNATYFINQHTHMNAFTHNVICTKCVTQRFITSESEFCTRVFFFLTKRTRSTLMIAFRDISHRNCSYNTIQVLIHSIIKCRMIFKKSCHSLWQYLVFQQNRSNNNNSVRSVRQHCPNPLLPRSNASSNRVPNVSDQIAQSDRIEMRLTVLMPRAG